MKAQLKVVSVFPDLLGTYGDSGNSLVVAKRIALRGFSVEVVEVSINSPVPSDGDFYLMGGGEDGPQAKAAKLLTAGAPLEKALDNGAALLAVCAGFQILGESFLGPDLSVREGIGIFGSITHRHDGPRSVGELMISPTDELGNMPALTGYENHQGITELVGDTKPLGTVLIGNGNNFGGQPRFDGAIKGRALGTYMHGPAFARNPRLCDYFISSVIGHVDDIADSILARAHDKLYSERISQIIK